MRGTSGIRNEFTSLVDLQREELVLAVFRDGGGKRGSGFFCVLKVVLLGFFELLETFFKIQLSRFGNEDFWGDMLLRLASIKALTAAFSDLV